MKVFILLSVVAVALARKCPENEHFESCGTACPLTCDNYNNPPRACILRCDIGCHCDEGFVRNSEGRCVEPQDCPSKAREGCGENKIYLDCYTDCILTCDNYRNPPKFCPSMCVSGCHCKNGFVWTRGGECVKPKNCPQSARQVCGENKRYLECGTACPLTCDNYQNPPKICPAMCVSGCHCEKGFVQSRDGDCVKPENCPQLARRFVKNCEDKPDPGFCMAYIPSWYYDVKTQKCQEFVYGGCGGNGNRYNTEEECLENCGANFAPTACQQEKVVGPCKANYKRFFFNTETQKCEEFTYGGCNGNSNNFHSQDECEAVCVE